MAVTNFNNKDGGKPVAPAHLSPESAAWWTVVVSSYVLESHHLKQLQIAAEAWDRSRQAREILDKEGLTVTDSRDICRPHPCISIERDCAIRCMRAVREMGLDVQPEESRAPGVRQFGRRK